MTTKIDFLAWEIAFWVAGKYSWLLRGMMSAGRQKAWVVSRTRIRQIRALDIMLLQLIIILIT